MSIDFKKKLRKEKSAQKSGYLKFSKIPIVKEADYYIVDVALDGEAPKQYIKSYFYYKNCPRKKSPKNWNGYYAKFGGKSYPHESIVEYAINKIGEALGIKMNETRLVLINNQLRFLSKDFLTSGKRLIHGIEILAEYFEDKQFVEEINENKKTRREFLTFDVIENAIKHVYPREANTLLKNLVQMIAFDALAGNNDRHFYNWGVIGDIKKEEEKGVVFAPIYDSARGLFWNHTQSNLLNMYKKYKSGSNKIDRYLEKSEPRFSFEQNPTANHFELIRYLSNYNQEYKNVINYLCTDSKEKEVLSYLNKEVFYLFSKERKEMMTLVINKRFNRIREIIYNN